MTFRKRNMLLLRSAIVLSCLTSAWGVDDTPSRNDRTKLESSSTWSSSSLSACIPSRNTELFHGENACDMEDYVIFKEGVRKNRQERYRSLKEETGSILKVPDAKTVRCPSKAIKLRWPDTRDGLDTTWFVENASSRPVVIAWVDPADKIEYGTGYADPAVTPAHDDPDSVLMPGEWKSLQTFEGHVFHVREILDDGTAGDLLLQHRVGLVAVGAHRRDLPCPAAAADDPPESYSVARDDENDEDDDENDENDYGEQPQHSSYHQHSCHTIELGFRNAANCPLYGYWNRPAVSEDSNETAAAYYHCHEDFRFHLGKDPRATDFMRDWQSPTKYESALNGWTYTFRLAADPAVLVDTYRVEPTRVTDCRPSDRGNNSSPSRTKKKQVGSAQRLASDPQAAGVVIVEGSQAAPAAGTAAATTMTTTTAIR